MGIQLVGVVLVRWAPHLSDRAFRVLVRMAATAMDRSNGQAPAGVYFGGHDLLAMTLRRERRGGTDETGLKLVQRAIAELIQLGAVERTSASRSGRRANYTLRLDAEIVGDSSGPPLGDSGGPPQIPLGDSSGTKWGTPVVPPRNNEEQPKDKENTKEGSGDARTDLAVARASSSTAKGTGFCLVCYESGTFTLALDEISGTACRTHVNVIPLRRPA